MSKIFDLLLLKLLFIFFIIALTFKSIYVPLTYDEAYSFLYFARPFDILSTALANNHPVNSGLMAITTLFSSDEFFIRLPNYLLGILYLFISYRVVQGLALPVLSFICLNASPYAFEFFSLGRGYGIAAGLIFIAFTIYFFKKSSKLQWAPLSLLLLASYAYYPVLILFVFFMLVWLKQAYQMNNYRAIGWGVLLFIAGSIFPIWAMLQVSQPNKPLYGDYGSLSLDYLVTLGGITTALSPNKNLLGALIAIFLIWPIFFYSYLSHRTKSLAFVFIGFVILYIVTPIAMGRPMPSGRLWVPFMPVFFLLGVSAYEDLAIKKPDQMRWVSWVVSVLIMSHYILGIRWIDTYDWQSNKVDPLAVVQFQEKNGVCFYASNFQHPSEIYYLERHIVQGNVYCDQGKKTSLK